MYRDVKPTIAAAVRDYPLKWRVATAMIVLAVLSIGTTKQWHFEPSNWHFEPVRMIAIGACSVACLFKPREKWFMFFFGIAFGDILLAALR